MLIHGEGINRKYPWITDGANKILFSLIENKKIKNVLEFGSGASTVWFLKNNLSVSSIEDNEEWFNSTKEYIKNNLNIEENNFDYKLIKDPINEILNETDISIACEEYKSKNKFFDLILIDGPCRLNCVLNSLSLLREDGYIIVDNFERYYVDCKEHNDYIKINEILSEHARIGSFKMEIGEVDLAGWGVQHFWITNIWKKVNKGE